MRYIWLLMVCVLVSASAARACPLCNEAVPATTGADFDDQMRESRAYNNSIYLMVGMPYVLFAGGSMWVYRGLRRKGVMDQLAIAQAESATLAGETAAAGPPAVPPTATEATPS